MEEVNKPIKSKQGHTLNPVTGKYITGRPVKWDETTLIAIGEELLLWYDESPENLFFESFLLSKGLYGELISQNIEKSEIFSQLIKMAKIKQEYKLNQLAIHNKVNPIYTMFFQKCKNGYIEKQEISVSGALPFSINFVPMTPKKIDLTVEPPKELPESGETEE